MSTYRSRVVGSLRKPVFLLAAVATALSTLTFAPGFAGPADARESEWYRCYVEDYGWMWCKDIYD